MILSRAHNNPIRLVVILLIASWLGACTGGAVKQSVEKKPTKVKRPAATPAPPRAALPTSVIVLQSSSSPAYAGVTREILRQWQGQVQVVHLDKEGRGAGVRRKIRASETRDIIAIGLPAARLASGLAGKKVVFCQVFNYEGENLIRPWMKGVSALPPVKHQFKAWKELNPRLRHIAVVVGKGLGELMAEARAVAKGAGIRLESIRVHSDLAFRAAVKRLGPEVQGLWLVPDNRVLSHRALQEVLELSQARGRQVLVMNEQLLSWGATLSADSDPGDIAHQAISRLHAAAGHTAIPGPDLLPLTKTHIKTRQTMQEPQASVVPVYAQVAGII